MAEYRLKISGMYCVQCEQRIRRALEGIRGVHNINVSYKRARAEFESDDGVTYDAALKAIEAEGYSVAARAGGRFPLEEAAVSTTAAQEPADSTLNAGCCSPETGAGTIPEEYSIPSCCSPELSQELSQTGGCCGG